MGNAFLLFARSFFAGLLVYQSTCVWPLVIGFLSLTILLCFRPLRPDQKSLLKGGQALLNAAAFVLGFSLLFSGLGAWGSGLGSAWGRYLPPLREIAGLLTILVSLVLVLPRFQDDEGSDKALNGTVSFLMGGAYAANWIPCVGPELSSMLNMAADAPTRLPGASQLFAYGLGMGSALLIAAVGMNGLSRLFRRYPALSRTMEVVAGLIMGFLGWLMFKHGMLLIR